MKFEMPSKAELDRQARFQNAQVAVDMSYRLAKDIYYPESEKIPNPDYVEGKDGYNPKYDYKDPNPEQKLAAYVDCARKLRPYIQADLDSTLSILEAKEVSDGGKAQSAELPRTS